jgi:hypothetical protein
MSNSHKHFYEFATFTLDPEERRLQRNGEVLPLTPKAFEVLLFLVENGGHALKKEEFLKRVWAGSYVEEKNLADNISLLRKVLGDDLMRSMTKVTHRRFAPGAWSATTVWFVFFREIWCDATVLAKCVDVRPVSGATLSKIEPPALVLAPTPR